MLDVGRSEPGFEVLDPCFELGFELGFASGVEGWWWWWSGCGGERAVVMVVVEGEEGEVEVERGEVGGVAESGSGDE